MSFCVKLQGKEVLENIILVLVKSLIFFPQNSVGTMYYKNYLCNEVDYNTGEIYPSLLHSSVGSCTSHFDLTNERRMKETGPVA